MESVPLQPTKALGMREFTVGKDPLSPGLILIIVGIVVPFSVSVVSHHRLIGDVQPVFFFPIALLLTALVLHSIVRKETVYVIPSLGIQLMQTTSLGTKSGRRFIPLALIKNVIINETIQRQRVISYLALTLHVPDSEGRLIVPLFRETLPNLSVTTHIYKAIYESLQKFK